MKKISYLLSGTLALPNVIADFGTGCFGGGMMDGYRNYGMIGGLGIGLYSIVWVALLAFVFAIVFWSIYKWLIGGKNKKRR